MEYGMLHEQCQVWFGIPVKNEQWKEFLELACSGGASSRWEPGVCTAEAGSPLKGYILRATYYL